MPVLPTSPTRSPADDAASDLGEPFATAADAWFWYMACQQARLDGARVVAGAGKVRRPCEPGDIHHVLLRLHRQGRLGSAHLRVLLRHGRTMLAPDPRRAAHTGDLELWQTALDRLGEALRAKGIVA